MIAFLYYKKIKKILIRYERLKLNEERLDDSFFDFRMVNLDWMFIIDVVVF